MSAKPMVDRIAISAELRDYIELLHYEKMRYEDLLSTVSRNATSMTDEEWASSLEYFQGLYRDARIRYRSMTDAINEMYADELAGRDWFVDFVDVSIKFPPAKPKEPNVNEMEQYADQLSRLYPLPEEDRENAIGINGSHCKSITVQVTDTCNMACHYCYQHNKGQHGMPFEVGKKFVDMILDSDEMTNSYITSTKCNGVTFEYIGGEPWLEVDLIAKLSDYIIAELFRRKHPLAIKFMFGICSNGLLHFDPRVQAYLKKHMLHLSYNISIDGDKDLHDSCRVDLAGAGTYDRAMAGVQQFRDELGGRMGSKMTISPENVHLIGDAVKDMVRHGYNTINLNCVYEEGWNNAHAKELYWQLHNLTDWVIAEGLQDTVSFSILKDMAGKPMPEDDDKNWCGGVGAMLAVDYKGDIYPCIRYMESSVGGNAEPYVIGNIRDGINVKDEHRERVKCMECITRRSQSTDECWNCPIAMGCGWCSGYNYELYGTQNKRATFICCMHKARSLATFYYQRMVGNTAFELHCPREWAVEIIGEEEFDKLASMQA